MKSYKTKAKVKIFPQKGGWTYVSIPQKLIKNLLDIQVRGLIPIVATVGKTSWKTSLLPKGDGTHFIALNAKVRKQEKIQLGKIITISFVLRKDWQ